MTSICWRCRKEPFIECEKSKCCYDASCKALFDYEQYANSEHWKKIKQQMESEQK